MSYDKLLAAFSRILISITAVMFIIMTVLVCLQVFYRYVLNSPLTGSEEAARAILIYIVMLGSAVAVGDRAHMEIRFFYDRFPPVLKRLSTLLYFAAILAIALLLIVQGWDLAQRTMMQTTPALQMPKGMIVYAFPIGGLLMCVYAVGLIVRVMSGAEDDASPKNDLLP